MHFFFESVQKYTIFYTKKKKGEKSVILAIPDDKLKKLS